VRLSVESWDPAYGLPGEAAELEEGEGDAVLDVEMAAAAWAPRDPATGDRVPEAIVFVDGVRRVDARAWVHAPDSTVAPALCATYAAGAVRCTLDHPAELSAVLVERGLFTASPHGGDIVTRAGAYPLRAVGSPRPEALILALQARMGELEVAAAEAACSAGCDLLVVDGPLRGRAHLAPAVGFVKTHHVAYLPPAQHAVIGALAPGQRTPVFATGSAFSRYAWYLRLPSGSGVRGAPGGFSGQGTPWAGVVRCEAPITLGPETAVALADRASAALPRFASEAHKEPRAPQNLYPIAGLERELRRRLGDEALLYRALRLAAA
jgi:hypothetical protein